MSDNKFLTVKIKPEINPDGWYAQCNNCWKEIFPNDDICPCCGQYQDWSWFRTKKLIKTVSI